METFVDPALNYANVRTLEDFQRWAEEAFKLPFVGGASRRDIALALFELLNVKEQRLTVREANSARMSAEMRLLMSDPIDGLYSVLGFHLPREGLGAIVAFRKSGER